MDLHEEIERAKAFCAEAGLDTSVPVGFHIIPYYEMDSIAARSGFPRHYSHWKIGQSVEEIIRKRERGLLTIFELVINNHPFHAYLLEGNPDYVQKTVIPHVFAHTDFFSQNMAFSHTAKNMLDRFGTYAAGVEKLMEKLGVEVVENFITDCLTLDNLIDENCFFARKQKKGGQEEDEVDPQIYKIKAKDYMEEYINPEESIMRQFEEIEQRKRTPKKNPERPEKDILQFLIDNAPLKNWQRYLLAMVRDEAYYFLPQKQTKIMNEGWACYWHSKILTGKMLTCADFVDFADFNSKIMEMPDVGINPYKIGRAVFEDIERRWNTGRHGKEFDDCADIAKKESWDAKENRGKEKIFLVRKVQRDIGFLEEFFTEEVMEDIQAKVLKKDSKERIHELRDFKTVKDALIKSLQKQTRMPVYAVDANFHNRGELLLVQRYEGLDIDSEVIQKNLQALRRVWNRPVNIEIRVDDKWQRRRYENKEERFELAGPSVEP